MYSMPRIRFTYVVEFVRCLRFVTEGTMSGEQLRESVIAAIPKQGSGVEAMH
jgi:hypothetical protein